MMEIKVFGIRSLADLSKVQPDRLITFMKQVIGWSRMLVIETCSIQLSPDESERKIKEKVSQAF